ncbi:MAG: hypothetical protein ACLU4N_01445 [Butyricimonas faecihominis]
MSAPPFTSEAMVAEGGGYHFIQYGTCCFMIMLNIMREEIFHLV